MRKLLLGLVGCLIAAPCAAQIQGNIPPNYVIGNPQSFNAPPQPAPFSAILGPNGVKNSNLNPGPANTTKGSLNGTSTIDIPWPNCQDTVGQHLNWTPNTGPTCGTSNPSTVGLRKITAAYTVQSSDCNSLIAAGGNSFYAVTLPSPLAEGCRIRITNTDKGQVTGGRGKKIAGIAPFKPNQVQTQQVLYPGQEAEVVVINGAWAWTRVNLVYYVVDNPIHIYVDCGVGNNSNDGLAPGSGGAFLDLQIAYIAMSSLLYLNGNSGGQVEFDSTGVCTNGLHIPGVIPGSAGRAGTLFNGQGTTFIVPSVASSCFDLYEKAVIEFTGFNCQNAHTGGTGGGFGISVQDGALAILIGGNFWCLGNGAPGSGGVFFTAGGAGSEIDFYADQNVGCTSGTTYNLSLFSASDNAVIAAVGHVVQFANNIVFANPTVLTSFGGLVYNPTYNTAGHLIFGTRFQCNAAGMIAGTGGNLTYIPGDVAGTTAGCTAYQ